MRFGQTIQESVLDKWKLHAVDYQGMKRTLPKDIVSVEIQKEENKLTNSGNVIPLDHDRYRDYWMLYEKSKQVIMEFYQERETWAIHQMQELTGRVEKIRLTYYSGIAISSNPPIEELKISLADFDKELSLIIDFLELNHTAFSKILKKYDKRTLSSVRQPKLEELKLTHGFLNAVVLSELKNKLKTLILKIEQLKPDEENTFDNKTRKIVRQRRTTLQKAQSVLKDLQKDSKIFNQIEARSLPTFTDDEIITGPILGQGEFGTVREIKEFQVYETCHICFFHRCSDFMPSKAAASPNHQRRFARNEDNVSIDKATQYSGENASETHGMNREKINHPCIQQKDPPSNIVFSDPPSNVVFFDGDDCESDHDDDEDMNRGFMKDHCIRSAVSRYAIKQLRGDLTGSKLQNGAVDIAIEAKFLATLSHPNIIKTRGTGGVKGDFKFFLVLDRLFDTLDIKIEKWSKEIKTNYRLCGRAKKGQKSNVQGCWRERLIAALDVARALKYMHKNEILYRDLKPENIGFDIRGDAKIFDFGIAKELLLKDKIGQDQYNISGQTGTRRYMAPEIALCKPYGLPADVYSFAILLWEILSLKMPFPKYTCEKHAKFVVLGHKRPKLSRSWPVLIKNLIKESWSHSARSRPNLSCVYDVLRGEFSDFSSNHSVELMKRSSSSRERLRN